MNWKLTLAVPGDRDELQELIKSEGEPFEHASMDTDIDELHLFTYLFDTLEETEQADARLAKIMRQNFLEHSLAAFHCEGTWKKLVLN